MKVLIRPNWAGGSAMKRTRNTPEQIINKLKTADQLLAQGQTVAGA
jgi:putative transposase